jgi:hypothetical protein
MDSRSCWNSDDKRTDPYHLSHAVRTCVTMATDHLHGICTLVLEARTVHLASPATLARGALECAAAATWMMHPSGRDECIARCLRWNVKDMRDGNTAVVDEGITPPTSLSDRLDLFKNISPSSTRIGAEPGCASGGALPVGSDQAWSQCRIQDADSCGSLVGVGASPHMNG